MYVRWRKEKQVWKGVIIVLKFASLKFASQHTGKITVLRHFCFVLQTFFFARLTIDRSHF